MSLNTKSKQKNNRNYWKEEEEKIIQEWADKAQCYQWMHSRCREIYQSKNACYTIPVIIISTVTGTANFAQDRFSDKVKEYVVMSIGTLSIIAGIITTVYQFLKISELNEGHRVAAVSWGKFYNNLKTTGSLHPLDRIPSNEAIKIYKDEYDRLIEVSPLIIPKVLSSFNDKFKKNTDLIKPEIGDKLDSTQIYQMDNNDRQTMINTINNISINKKFVDTFFNLNGREPSENELDSNTESNHLNMEIYNGSSSSIESSKSNVIQTSNVTEI